MHKLRLLYGGTFDPIHLGHLHTAKAAYHAFNQAPLAFIPCFEPVHKDHPITKDHRFAMLKLALEDYPHFSIESWEIKQKRPCYALETLSHLRKQYPNASLAWIIGSDQDLTTWHHWPDLFKLAHFIRVPRDHHPSPIPDQLKPYITEDKSEIISQNCGKIYTLSTTPMVISSTDIRTSLAAGEPSDKLPDAVATYIHQNQLYRIST